MKRLRSAVALVLAPLLLASVGCRRSGPPPLAAIPLPTEAPAGPCTLFRAEGIELCLPASLGHGVRGATLPAPSAAASGLSLGRRILRVEGYPASGPSEKTGLPVPEGDDEPGPASSSAGLTILAVADAGREGSPLASRVRWLDAAVKRRPPFSLAEGLAGGRELAELWGAPGAPFLAHPFYLGLEWGASGLRGVTVGRLGPDGSGAGIVYLFAGLTLDGRWLVLASFPVSAPLAGTARKGTGAEGALLRDLERIEEDRYAPTLGALDDLVRSIRIDSSVPAASSSSSSVNGVGSR